MNQVRKKSKDGRSITDIELNDRKQEEELEQLKMKKMKKKKLIRKLVVRKMTTTNTKTTFANDEDLFTYSFENDRFSSISTTFSHRKSNWMSSTLLLYIVFVLLISYGGVVQAAPLNTQQRGGRELDLVNLPAGNTTSSSNFHEISKNAFLSLQGVPIEAKLPAYRIGGEGTPGNELESDEHELVITKRPPVKHQHRQHHRKKNKKQKFQVTKPEIIYDGRKHALMQLADPDALLMPTKCDGQKFKQRVRADGCLTKVVINRLCHGTCRSYFIPRQHSKKLKAAFKSCATCAPSDYDFVDITLDCPGQNPPTATRTIVKVKSCKCREVSISSLYA